MVKNPVMVNPDTPCSEIARIMKTKKIGSLMIEEKGQPVSIVTERDLVHRLLAEGKDPNKCTAAMVSSSPVVAVSIHADIDMAVDIMNDYKIRRIVVVDEKDNVATALRRLEEGESLQVSVGGKALDVTVLQPVPFGHKIALIGLEKGQPVVKYGEVIGLATQSIGKGEHTHVHNVEGPVGRNDGE